MTARGLSLDVLRADLAQTRANLKRQSETCALLTRMLSAVADANGGTVVVNGYRFEAMAGRAFKIDRPTRPDSAPDDPTDITFALLPTDATATTASDAPAEPPVEPPKLRIVGG
jgi:hypothetical protein